MDSDSLFDFWRVLESSLGLDSNFIESLEVLETLESFNFGELDSNLIESLEALES
ncbi:hypothetical protein HPMG_01679 [Helicobacter pullorum MIT 98-5489]|uniref:Uncharacterized protein n=1 Tax=Helicobacter pullorum MIT 98-5489 TaxID=537972 RepID=C5F1R7_9HELI|nr:hypothetical protein HPMG_01679 [Helicobacter pullorum MIT 98-5489]